jgi:hypothetical protein
MQTYSAVASEGRADLGDRVVRMWRLLLPGIAVPPVIVRTEASEERSKALFQAVTSAPAVPARDGAGDG